MNHKNYSKIFCESGETIVVEKPELISNDGLNILYGSIVIGTMPDVDTSRRLANYWNYLVQKGDTLNVPYSKILLEIQ